MDLKDLLDMDLVWLNQPVKSRQEIFNLIGEKAFIKGKANELFSEKLAEREAVFPTGLQLKNYGIAIPHTDPEYINEPFIAVLTSEEGVEFNRMDDESEVVDVNIVFVLGLMEPHQQLSILQELMKCIQSEEFLEDLRSSQNKQNILSVFNQEY